MTEVKLHGILGEQMGAELWKISVKSVGEAMNAIDILSGRKFYKQLLENDKSNIKYKVIINGKLFKAHKKLETLQDIKESELAAKRGNLQSIDIVPLIEGADDALDIIAIVVGVILIAAGIFLIATPFGVPLILAGIGLIAAGVINLLSSPPEFEPPQFGGSSRFSFLFSGPANVTGEGSNVPLIFGEVIAGSHVISASFEISDIDATEVNPDEVLIEEN